MNAIKKMNVYTVLFFLFGGAVATLLGVASVLLMMDMLGFSISSVMHMLGISL